MPRLVLIDGSSYFYRAFHALPPLSNSAGEPTGALFGVVNMLRSTLKENPDFLAFVLDASGPTFRDELDPEYKANRPPMPDDLRAQREPMVEIVEALGIPLLRVPGVEADDVIGTLAEAGAKAGMDVIISTSDKDFAQLVGPGITLVNTMSGSVTDRERVIEKFGVPPERIIDFLALMGDKVDNVPGVDKCGPKTAAKWLAKYDDLDGVIANADDVGGKVGENLRAVLERLPLNRDLVTIRTTVELDRGPQELARGERDTEKLRELFGRFEMNQALRELDGGAVGDNAKPAPAPSGAEPAAVASGADEVGEYRCVTEQADFDELVEQLKNAELVCFDTETTSLDPLQATIVGLSFATEPGKAAYVPLAHDYPGAPKQLDRDSVLAALKPIFEDDGIAKLAQHGKYDMHVLAQHGIAVNGYAFDSMLESFVYRAGLSRHDMDSLASRYLGYQTMKYEDVCGKGARQIPFSAVDLDTATRYAAEDADITLRLHRHLWPELQKEEGLQRVFSDIEMPLVPVLFRIEENGVQIDADELRRQSNDLGRRQHAAQQRAHEIAGQNFNLDSPKQLQGILFEQLGLPVIAKTPKGQPSTNEDVLEQLADQHELPQLILEYRGLAKLRSTYTEKLPEAINPRTGRVHTSYHQAGAATGRLSSSDPNLQN
ncbi:MAG: DNA polymerase I, partial [Xanthomonadales bacterium]|nr:DNA polymerase I [Xanthomonadales bacterium]